MSSEGEETDKQDLDAFLSGVESKLRGPFSSLDLARAVAGAPSPRDFLKTLAKVFPRMDKVVQLRVLVGLLGVDPSDDTDSVIHEILTQAQEAPLHEDWVRVAAGVVQGVMFSGDTGERDVGEEARKHLEKTCNAILEREPTSAGADMGPLFAPHYYSLLNPDTLRRVLPECLSNPYFSVNEDADILKLDEKFEREEQAAATAAASRVVKQAAASSAPTQPPAIMPGRGMMKTGASSKQRPAAPKSSMFLPSRKPAAVAAGKATNRLKSTRMPGLHTRKAGAAQKLLGKSRRTQTTTASPGSTGSSTTGTMGTSGGGRASKFGNTRSKMKMIDVSEVQGLTKEHQERDSREQKMSARKRKIMEAAAAKGLVSSKVGKRSKLNPGEETTGETTASDQAVATNGTESLEATAAAALLAYQKQTPSVEPTNAPAPAPAPAIPQTAQPPVTATDRMELPPGNHEEMNQLLEKSNKLSQDDRMRIQKFFIDRVNPSPEQPIYRMKLHEERSLEPETGLTIKTTDYLELDYNTFGYKRLRKTKKK